MVTPRTVLDYMIGTDRDSVAASCSFTLAERAAATRPETLAYMDAHNDAFRVYSRGDEVGIVRLCRAIAEIVSRGETRTQRDLEAARRDPLDSWPEPMLTPIVGGLLDGVVALLDYPTGRIDGGKVSAWADLVAARIGWSRDETRLLTVDEHAAAV